MKTLVIVLISLLFLNTTFSQTNNIDQTYPLPIFVTGMVHLDPLPSTTDTNMYMMSYNSHRGGMLWYISLAQTYGLSLSAQMTGVYAEACIGRGHWSDFISFMPGGIHHLGTHLHANVKPVPPLSYVWRTIPQLYYHTPDSVRKVFHDNLPWLNQIFINNGHLSTDNLLLHGSHAIFDGMDTILFNYGDTIIEPYNNVFSIVGGSRGHFYYYRGGFLHDPDVEPGNYIKFSEVGGIIGFDQLHGPEGMVYGTVPYQKRDFLRVYLEWRESVRENDPSAVRHFTWMVHPYQLVPGYLGTDSIPIRTSIEQLVIWLNDNFINKTDESGNTMAVYKNGKEIKDLFVQWENDYPQKAAQLQATLQTGQKPFYLRGIYRRLDSCYYVQKLSISDTSLILHKLRDHHEDKNVYAAWTKYGNRNLEPHLTGDFIIINGDSVVTTSHSSNIVITNDPVLLIPGPSIGIKNIGEPAMDYELYQNYPNPFNPSTTIRFSISKSSYVTLKIYNVLGKELINLVSEKKGSGTYEYKFESKNLASGIYFYTLQADDFRQTRKMLLLK